MITLRHREQRTQICLGRLRDRDIVLAAVAHFHHRLARAVPIEHLVGRSEQHLLGKSAGAGAEVEDACHELRSCLSDFVPASYTKVRRASEETTA